MSNDSISRDDIRNRLVEIQDEATDAASDAKTQIIAGAVAVGAVVVLLAFMVGRSRGKKKSTVIEVRRR